MSASPDIVTLCADLGTLVDVGRLTEDAPLIVQFPAHVVRYSRVMPTARLWLCEIDGSVMLRVALEAGRVTDRDVDLGEVRDIVVAISSGMVLGSVQLTEEEETEGHLVHHVIVHHAVPHQTVTAALLQHLFRRLIRAWRRTQQVLSVLIDRGRREQTTGHASAATAQVMAELDALVGLAPVKAIVRQLAAQQTVAAHRMKAGLKVPPISPHLVFSGNPGTGKTTVARLIGQLYVSLGLLEKGHVVSVDRGSLVAAYLGQTALKTKEACERALGGVLFIDEAYSLVVDGRDYGREAIETLLTFMEDHRNEVVVIAAGYPAEMTRFLRSNPGLQSRFDVVLDFPDYTTHELCQIFTGLVLEHEYLIERRAMHKVRDLIATLPRGPAFGNAREVRNLFNTIVCNQAAGLAHVLNPSVELLRSIPVSAVPTVACGQRALKPAEPSPDPIRSGYL